MCAELEEIRQELDRVDGELMELFKAPDIRFAPTFAGVFQAVEEGECRYGILPIENSTAGSVKGVYDLMDKHNFSIVRSARMKVSHNLLALPGTRLEDVREVEAGTERLRWLGTYSEMLC